MESIQVNMRTPVRGFVNLNIDYIIEKNGELNIKLLDTMCYNINAGDRLYFRRATNRVNTTLSFEDSVIVKSEDSDHVLHTTIPLKRQIRLFNNFYEFKFNETESYHIITCKEPHYLFGQDLEVPATQVVYFKKYDGTVLGSCTGIRPLHEFRKDELTKYDCLTNSDFDETCGKEYDRVETKHYEFSPFCASPTEFILDDFNEIELSEAEYIETEFNPYYYYTIVMGLPSQQSQPEVEPERGAVQPENPLVPIELDDYGNPIKHCHLYGDLWFDSFIDTPQVKYVNDAPSNSDVIFDMNYYSLPIGVYSDSNETNLGNEDYFSEQFAKNVEDSLIPDFVDMERVKYVPYGRIYTGAPLTSITIYPHFRKRELVDLENNTNSFATSGNLYYDGWYINADDSYDIYWNGCDVDENDVLGSISDFVNDSGKTSDLIGFLNFNDNDIFYKKRKVSKSFFRFSFYSSSAITEQKLLYYSTVFLDSGELFSKFLKQSSFIQSSAEYDVIINDINFDSSEHKVKNENVKVVFCENTDVDCRVDSTIKLTNEYDRERSSEGFNLYLFADDAPEGNEEKTIYMKVEFNHAGNGKTIPMIVMPTDTKLTMENFLEHLFIPIKITKQNGIYIYRIMKATDNSDGNADLCLFEPKLELE